MMARLGQLSLILWCFHFLPCNGFLVAEPCRSQLDLRSCPETSRSMSKYANREILSRSLPTRPKTSLSMYNLPPSGGGGGRNSDLRQILTSVATLAAIVAFFASPLGALFFAVLNSFFLLSLLLPVLGWIAFQGWLFFNTVEGPCPQCGAPVRVAKQDESPSICLNCGTFVQVTSDKSSVDFYTEEDQVVVDEGYTASIWENIMSGPMGARSAPTRSNPQERQARFRREQTVIDVEVEDEG